ncbi:SAM and PH domain-containing protein [Aspergillus puulaauensis]|uniref:SAM and PH domain protein n=1 Tax=Aspergillus puulaauensis TaxID=1220207 RepID=A0A7R7XP84_9EURO|nr:uncharacterized protein APUU_41286S [Aspergillus puulaauensis]BCS24842.1 hypothetical protein APUU_41286S [Aspergillus puulaauensis]
MDSARGFQTSFDYIKTQQSLFQDARTLPRYRSRSAISDATTEIFDSDYDSDSLDDTSNSSLYRSGSSLVAESVTTLSSVDEIKTPQSTGLSGFPFQIDESPIKGPQGPHLFRTSEDSLSRPQLTPVEQDPTSAVATHFYTGFNAEPERRDTPLPDNVAPTPPPAAHSTSRRESGINIPNWSPNQVVRWMRGLGFEESVTEKFLINDISGSILLELQIEDLKELEIASFGKRHQLMACIKKLRECSNSSATPSCDSRISTPASSLRQDTQTPQTISSRGSSQCTSQFTGADATRTRSGSRSSGKSGKGHERQDSRQKRGRQGTEVVPQDSVSIVAIEQLLPKLHVCSKGENCRKWQKQQTRVARLLKDLQLEGLGGSVLVAGDPGNAPNAPSLMKSPQPEARSETRSEARPPALDLKLPMLERTSAGIEEKTPKSDITPSLVASSDIMGANHQANLHLSQAMLEDVQTRDPQENVRNFLNFQRFSGLQPATDPATPPMDTMSMTESPKFAQGNQTGPPGPTGPTLTNNLRHLPKLHIPSMHAPSESTFSPSYSALRTVTPSVIQKSQQFPATNRGKSPNPYGSLLSPSDFYRDGAQCEQGPQSPGGEDPMTAVPLNPVERACSQSVPPDMRFGGQLAHKAHDAQLAASKAETHRRLHSAIQTNGFKALVPVAEGSAQAPIDTLEDLEKTAKTPRYRHNPMSPGSAHADDIIHSGWMKKRKTTKFIRHEWEDRHFALRGTNLCMYPDEKATEENDKSLERIDVDDYAVACSSLQSSSKLTAAFKKTVLKRVNDKQGDAAAAFAFSLIPAPNNSGTAERKPLLSSGPKSHHFSVKSREERIDWMRELMLAKALRRGRESGDLVNLNGEPF